METNQSVSTGLWLVGGVTGVALSSVCKNRDYDIGPFVFIAGVYGICTSIRYMTTDRTAEKPIKVYPESFVSGFALGIFSGF